jgi:hypothetical protein
MSGGKSLRLGAAVVALLAAGAAGTWVVIRFVAPSDRRPAVTPNANQVAAMPDAVLICGSCHALPPPNVVRKDMWPGMLKLMVDRIEANQLSPKPTPEQLQEIEAYYTSRAPEKLPVLSQSFPASPLVFSPTIFGDPPPTPGPGTKPPVMGKLNIVDLDKNGQPDVLVTDITGNKVSWCAVDGDHWRETPLGEVTAPATAIAADLFGTGRPDVVVASLGTIKPTEDPVGGVYMFSKDAHGQYTRRTLVDHAPRVADVHAADLDGDGDLDLVVAEYGMYKTGGVVWLEQTSDKRFASHLLYPMHGVGFALVGDINGDKRPDIVALVSQESERVVALINTPGPGGVTFEPRVLYQGPHPAFGSAWIDLVDLDGDGDLDVLYSNGDSLDLNTEPKPYHGVQWLENQGDLKFVYHDIARFYGAYGVAAADLDGDGDLDIVVTSMDNFWNDPSAQSVIWLENDGKQQFTPHPLASAPISQVAVAIADLTGDGKPDLLTSSMYVLPPYTRVGRLTLWVNGGRKP